MSAIAFLVDEMFEDSEFRVPFERVRAAGYEPVIVGLEAGKTLTGKKGTQTITTDVAVADVDPERFAGLVIPGGYSPDHLRTNADAVELVHAMFEQGKPVAAICHAGSMLVEADVVRGKVVTSWPSIKTDLLNAGADWVDREVVQDGSLITSRKPHDLPAFCDALLRDLVLAGAQQRRAS
jgi:protease I